MFIFSQPKMGNKMDQIFTLFGENKHISSTGTFFSCYKNRNLFLWVTLEGAQ
jgi:hypothetical protein